MSENILITLTVDKNFILSKDEATEYLKKLHTAYAWSKNEGEGECITLYFTDIESAFKLAQYLISICKDARSTIKMGTINKNELKDYDEF